MQKQILVIAAVAAMITTGAAAQVIPFPIFPPIVGPPTTSTPQKPSHKTPSTPVVQNWEDHLYDAMDISPHWADKSCYPVIADNVRDWYRKTVIQWCNQRLTCSPSDTAAERHHKEGIINSCLISQVTIVDVCYKGKLKGALAEQVPISQDLLNQCHHMPIGQMGQPPTFTSPPSGATSQSDAEKSPTATSHTITEAETSDEFADLVPPGDCLQSTYDTYRSNVEKECKTVKRSCNLNDDVEALQEKETQNIRCAEARKMMNYECFRGGDQRHRDLVSEAYKSASRCRELIERAQTQPH